MCAANKHSFQGFRLYPHSHTRPLTFSTLRENRLIQIELTVFFFHIRFQFVRFNSICSWLNLTNFISSHLNDFQRWWKHIESYLWQLNINICSAADSDCLLLWCSSNFKKSTDSVYFQRNPVKFNACRRIARIYGLLNGFDKFVVVEKSTFSISVRLLFWSSRFLNVRSCCFWKYISTTWMRLAL